MSIPLWLPWAVLAALAIPAALATGLRDQSGAGPLRTVARRWAAPLIALVVAVSLTADHAKLTEDELFDAVEQAADRLDGSLGNVTPDRLSVTVADELGRDVSVETGAEDVVEEGVERVYFYDVGVAEQDDGPLACVRVTVSDLTPGSGSPAWVTLFAEHGRCQG